MQLDTTATRQTMKRPSITDRTWRRRRWLGSSTAVVAAALIGAGCGGSSATTPSAAAPKTSGSVPQGMVGQTLTVQFTPPVSLNPALEGTSQSDIDFGRLDYDSLIYQLPNGSYVPDLATSWGYVSGSQNEKFTMTIRGGVQFSDGSPVTPRPNTWPR
jgi:ABC-type transport system substrate-binding protein